MHCMFNKLDVFYNQGVCNFKAHSVILKYYVQINGKSRYLLLLSYIPIVSGTSVIPHFHVILTGQSISCIIFMIQGHFQGQKVNFIVK